MKKTALFSIALVVAAFGLVSCGGGSNSALTTRIFASQSVSTPTAFPGLLIIDGENDTPARASEISAGTSPGLMAISSDRATLLVFDSAPNGVNNTSYSVDVVNTQKQSETGTIPLAGTTTSMVALPSGFGYAAVPAAPFESGTPPGAIQVMNLTAGGITATVAIPNAQTVVATPDGSQLLVFGNNNSDVVTIMSPLLVNTGNPVTASVAGFDRPVYALFSPDGGTAYVLNCGPQCGSATASASVQILNLRTTPPTPGASVAVDGATIGLLTTSGSTLYVAGTSPTNNLCTGQNTKAPKCGRLNIVDTTSMTVTTTAVITDGYHDRIDLSSNGQLFIGSNTCSTVGDVNNPVGEVRGCLSIFNTTNGTVVIPPDNGDVTGLQGFTSRNVEYVAEGGNLRVYDTTQDILLVNTIISGTIGVAGQIIDVKAVDFF